MLTKPAMIRAQFGATVHPLEGWGGRPGAPISRQTIELLTGLAPRTQQYFDSKYQVSTLVQQNYALIETRGGPAVTGHGYFRDGRGRQMKRLPDSRTPRDQTRGSKSAARNANALRRFILRRSERSGQSGVSSSDTTSGGNGLPTSPERPERRHFQRRYYTAATEEGARARMRHDCDFCAHKRSGDCPHLSGVLVWRTADGWKSVIREKSK